MSREAKLVAFYQKHDPSKVGNVAQILDKFPDEQLDKMLYEKYGDTPDHAFQSASGHNPTQTQERRRQRSNKRQSVMLMDNIQGYLHSSTAFPMLAFSITLQV
jgi:hypothetical protein